MVSFDPRRRSITKVTDLVRVLFNLREVRKASLFLKNQASLLTSPSILTKCLQDTVQAPRESLAVLTGSHHIAP